MADALISPAVGGVMWGASATVIAVSSRKIVKENRTENVPMMGVLGAFVFAAQMINFSIPGTGSSGHLSGALLLAILLGPYAGFLVIASVLIVQALFFADGGILALGANMFNMGFFACFLAYPFVYRPIAGAATRRVRLFVAAIIAAVAGVASGAAAVVVETVVSGISILPFGPFLAAMVPIHVAIGVVEGIVTGFVLVVIGSVEPALMSPVEKMEKPRRRIWLMIGILACAAVIAGLVSWFASSHPDGLEWSVAGVTGGAGLESPDGAVYDASERVQGRLSFLPDYGVRGGDSGRSATSAAGLVGAGITLILVFAAAVLLRKRARAGGRNRGESDAGH